MQGSKRVEKFLCIKPLAESLNLPAVATVNDLGVDKAFEAGENSTQQRKGRPYLGVMPWEAVSKPILFKWLKHYAAFAK